jgi:hypothetical protein
MAAPKIPKNLPELLAAAPGWRAERTRKGWRLRSAESAIATGAEPPHDTRRAAEGASPPASLSEDLQDDIPF